MTLNFKSASSPSPDSPSIFQKHPRFYFSDGNVVFRVEDTLYRIHRYFFQRDSPIFETMFSLPPPIDARPEGEEEDRPIQLEGIECRDFDRLLSVMYPKSFNAYESSTTEEWTSVLKLATRWDFDSIRELAVESLTSSASPADLIILAHRYDVSQWLLPEYMELCVRDEPLSLEEGRKLGVNTVVAINQIRHQIRYRSNLNRHNDAIAELVQSVFITGLVELTK
ncbi:hypothetical protein J3R30DRAFT_1090883 [Lentinula aciculospora]|uniref:BTB domain-containing protein n=1 Tax=Lentinula aciculospora TaxID=153920 RepID=A0A9W9DI25_9AGAR|nr:hypothetical protein J3R30DRAFT_1090883 [Lentinula aciculospora]